MRERRKKELLESFLLNVIHGTKLNAMFGNKVKAPSWWLAVPKHSKLVTKLRSSVLVHSALLPVLLVPAEAPRPAKK